MARFQILIAEDNATDVALIRQALNEQQLDCALHVTTDGAKAIAFMKALETSAPQPPLHLLIADVHLPRRDGYDVVKALQQSPKLAATPAIILSASASTGAPETGGAETVRHVPKPASLSELMQLGALLREVLCGADERCPAGAAGAGTQTLEAK